MHTLTVRTVVLDIPGCGKNNGIAPQLRNKFQMNENARRLGLHTVQQVLATTWDEAKNFILHTLWG